MTRVAITAYAILLAGSCADTSAGFDAQAARLDAQPGSDAMSLDVGSLPDANFGDAIPLVDVGETAPDASTCGVTLTATCSGSLSEARCGAVGGVYLERLNPNCACPTPDVGCPCDDSDDCVGLCVDLSIPGARECRAVRSGVCSEHTNVVSCACILGPVVGLGIGEPGYRCL